MRLSLEQLGLILSQVHQHLGPGSRIWLFGSRLDDTRRGGDVDLYVEAPPHPLMDELRCKIALQDALALPVDLVVRDFDADAPLSVLARTEGQRL